MIVIPIALVIAQHALIGAGRGALMGAITGTIGGTITSAREGDTIRGIIVVATNAGLKGAVQGAKVGAVFGAIGGVGHAIHLGRSARLARNYQKLPRDVRSGGYLYVMDDTANAVSKIGVTKNPARRIAEVQRQVGSKLNYTGIMPVDDMRAVERAWHRHFASQNIRHPNHLRGREWFKLSGRQAREIYKVGGRQLRLQQVADLAGAVASGGAGRQRRRLYHRHHPERKAKRKVIAKIEAEIKAEWEAKRRAEAERKEAEAERRKAERRDEAKRKEAEAERRKAERRDEAKRKEAEAEHRKAERLIHRRGSSPAQSTISSSKQSLPTADQYTARASTRGEVAPGL